MPLTKTNRCKSAFNQLGCSLIAKLVARRGHMDRVTGRTDQQRSSPRQLFATRTAPLAVAPLQRLGCDGTRVHRTSDIQLQYRIPLCELCYLLARRLRTTARQDGAARCIDWLGNAMASRRSRLRGKRFGPIAGNGRPTTEQPMLDRHAQPARGIHCLQLEVCRSTYLDASMTEPSARLAGLARLLAGLVRELAGALVAHSRDRTLPIAAE